MYSVGEQQARGRHGGMSTVQEEDRGCGKTEAPRCMRQASLQSAMREIPVHVSGGRVEGQGRAGNEGGHPRLELGGSTQF